VVFPDQDGAEDIRFPALEACLLPPCLFSTTQHVPLERSFGLLDGCLSGLHLAYTHHCKIALRHRFEIPEQMLHPRLVLQGHEAACLVHLMQGVCGPEVWILVGGGRCFGGTP